MSLLVWIAVGVTIGLVANGLSHGKGPGGLLGDLIMGVLGAFGGGWVTLALGWGGLYGLNVWCLLASFWGAVFLLLVFRLPLRRRFIY